MRKKPVVGFFSFTCCEGCEFTVLFLDNLVDILSKFDIKHFHLINEKDKEADFDIAFVEGAITKKDQIVKLKSIRSKSKMLVAMGACATHGGIPAMRNFVETDDLKPYVYGQHMLDDSIDAQPISNFVKIDKHLYGCPILKKEFVEFIESYLEGREMETSNGPVCLQCPRRGKNCFLQEKKVCLGALTNGGCDAICVRQDIPCIMCRGPLDSANFAAESSLLRSWGLGEKEIRSKLAKFGTQKISSAQSEIDKKSAEEQNVEKT